MHSTAKKVSRQLPSASVGGLPRPAQEAMLTALLATTGFLVVAFLLAPAELYALHFQEHGCHPIGHRLRPLDNHPCLFDWSLTNAPVALRFPEKETVCDAQKSNCYFLKETETQPTTGSRDLVRSKTQKRNTISHLTVTPTCSRLNQIRPHFPRKDVQGDENRNRKNTRSRSTAFLFHFSLNLPFSTLCLFSIGPLPSSPPLLRPCLPCPSSASY